MLFFSITFFFCTSLISLVCCLVFYCVLWHWLRLLCGWRLGQARSAVMANHRCWLHERRLMLSRHQVIVSRMRTRIPADKWISETHLVMSFLFTFVWLLIHLCTTFTAWYTLSSFVSLYFFEAPQTIQLRPGSCHRCAAWGMFFDRFIFAVL